MFRIRSFKSEDKEFVKIILSQVQCQYLDVLPGYIDGLSKYIDKEDFTPFGKIQIIENNDQKMGWIGYKYLSDTECYLGHLYLSQEYKGQGYGRKTVDYFSRTLKNLGFGVLKVDVHKEKFEVISFYDKIGFFKDQDNSCDNQLSKLFERYILIL